MNTTFLRLLALITGIASFDFLFYKQAPGLNALLLAPVILVLVKLSGRNPLLNKRLIISTTGLLIAGISVALYGSFLSTLAYFGAFAIFLGFSLEPELKSILSIVFQAGFNFSTAPFTLASESSNMLRLGKHIPWILKIIKLLVIPFCLLFIFTTIYRYANPVFNQLFQSLDSWLRQFLVWIEQYLSIGHILFLLFTALIFTGIIYKGRHTTGQWIENGKRDELLRVRKRKPIETPIFYKNTALKDEYRTGILILLMLNAVLLLVNTSEGILLNGEYHTTSVAKMSQNLHEGTGLLIFSILLSIMVMLFLFRKNLNFYPGNTWLVRGAFAWIIQNGILGIHVAIGNWYYISQYGLTYKRIGIFFFLMLVLTGLTLLYTKIRNRKTSWYLVRTNAWSLYVAFLMLGIINWDALVVMYNLRVNAPTVDAGYLLDLPGRSLRLMDENREKLPETNPDANNSIGSQLDKRIQYFMERQEKLEWQSRNFTDWYVCNYFKEKRMNCKKK